jgi:hypothetical protein
MWQKKRSTNSHETQVLLRVISGEFADRFSVVVSAFVYLNPFSAIPFLDRLVIGWRAHRFVKHQKYRWERQN